MARTLEQLQKQYNDPAKAGRGRGPGGGPRGRGPMGAGPKPAGASLKKNKGAILRLLQYLSPYKVHFVLVFLCMLLNTVTALVGSFMLLPIINRIAGIETTLQNAGIAAVKADAIVEAVSRMNFFQTVVGGKRPVEVFAYIVAALLIMGLVYLTGIATNYLQSRLMLHISQGSIERIRNDLFDKLQDLPVRYYDSHPTGETMSRFTNDVDNIDMMLNHSLVSIVSGIISLVGTFFFMITTNWILTLITIVFIPIFAKLGAAIAKRSHKYYGGQQAALGAVNGYIEESVTGQKVVKVFNHEEACVEEFGLLNGDLRTKQMKAQFYGGIMGPIMGNTSQISYAVTVGVGGILMCTSGFTPGALTVFANYSRQFSMPINMLSQQTSTIFSALAGAERVFAVMDAPPEPQDDQTVATPNPMKGNVVLENVTFGYTPEQTVLKNITMTAAPGEKIALVGSTGAGKTTITNLLNRFYDIREGSITIDGVNINQMNRKELRQNIAMVLQDTHLFTGTVMENIRYGRLDATDEEVIEAAKTANAHPFILRLSEGYDTMLEGDGANLSQGQRQLLNIARAALSKAPILVLDEATSSVDTRTERNIEVAMDRLMENRTTFVIAHRLSTVRNSKAIMVLEHGEIIERGSHEELLALKGRYYELYTGKKELD